MSLRRKHPRLAFTGPLRPCSTLRAIPVGEGSRKASARTPISRAFLDRPWWWIPRQTARRRDSIAACAKHYVGYGAAEGGRDYNTTWIPEILLRNVYLRPFHAVRDAGVATFMSGFNDLNGVPASGNVFTLRDVLRDEWKFDGMVVSDYNSITEMINHGYAADASDAAFEGARAGVDMEMVSTAYYDHLKSLVDARKVDIKLIDESVRNILRLKFRMGLFDDAPSLTGSSALSALDVARKVEAGVAFS